ncbi:hypothetical protein EV697_1171, partial [Bisgaardia hudsonensis]
FNAEKFNRQLHPNEIEWIKENAKRFAEQEGISTKEAEKRLSQQAAKELDILWFLSLDDKQDSQAQAFLASQKNKTFTHINGEKEHYFVAGGNDFWVSRKYAKEADTYNQRTGFISEKLTSGIVRTPTEGLRDKVKQTYKSVSENKLETVKKVGESVVNSAMDCGRDPLACGRDIVDNFVTTGKSSIEETYRNVMGEDVEEINRLYGQDMRGEMTAISTAQLIGTVGEVVGAGKVAKAGGKAVGKGVVAIKNSDVVKNAVEGGANQINRVVNYSTLNKVIDEVDNIAITSPSGYINAQKVCKSGCELKPTSTIERDLIADIVKNGDKTGEKTEKLVNSLAKRSGYKVLKGGKYGGNSGFDHVLQAKDGSIVIIDSKQITNGATKVSNKGAKLDNKVTNQLSQDWIEAVATEKFDLDKTDPAILAVRKALKNKQNQPIKTLIIGVDKVDEKIKLIPVEVPNK